MADITLYGAAWCSDCTRSKRQLDQLGVAYEYIDLEPVEAAPLVEKVIAMNDGKRIIPTIVFSDGTHLAEPSNTELADKLTALGVI